jgi:parallel beta-helix repeat protein
MVRDSTLRAFIYVGGGSKPTLTNNTIEQACIYIYGDGADPTIRDNRLDNSLCPNFAIGIIAGTAPTVQDNVINGVNPRGDGIRIHGAGSDPEVSRNQINGGLNGIWIGKESAPTLSKNKVSDATVGIAIVGSRPDVTDNMVTENGTGISVTLGADPLLTGNTLCDNDIDLYADDGTLSPSSEGKAVCGSGGPGDPLAADPGI